MDRDRLWLSFMLLAVTAVSAARLTPAREPNLHALFQRVAPAVALIETEEREPKAAGAPAATEEYTGSGFLITTDGKMMTAAHVVDGAAAISAKFCGSTPIKARVIAADPAADVA